MAYKGQIAKWKSYKNIVGAKPYVQGGQVQFNLPNAGIVKRMIIRFFGSTTGSGFAATAQPRSTARALGFLTFLGNRVGHLGFQMQRVPAHMIQLRERLLQGTSAVETAIAAAAGNFALTLSMSMMDPRMLNRGEMALTGLDLSQYTNPILQIDGGTFLAANGDNDNTAVVGTATTPGITGTITLELEMVDLLPDPNFMDNNFEYNKDEGTTSAYFQEKFSGDGLRMYDFLEAVGLNASGVETAVNAIPADGVSLIQIKADNNPVEQYFGPSLQEDETPEFFPTLSAAPTGIYILDHSRGSISGQMWKEKYGKAIQNLIFQNASAGTLGVTTVKLRWLHLTLTP